MKNEVSGLVFEDRIRVGSDWGFHGVFHDQDRLLCENSPFHHYPFLSFDYVPVVSFYDIINGAILQ